METLYVKKKSEMTEIGKVIEKSGCEMYRARIKCGCTALNMRDGVLLAKGGSIKMKIVRCCLCVRREDEKEG